MKEVREKLVQAVSGGDRYESVLIPGSGTAAIEATLCSILPENGKILMIDNGFYGRRMLEICRVHYRKERIKILKAPDHGLPDLDALERLLKEDGEISHLAVVHHETMTGLLNPLEEIFSICRRHQVDIVVDAMSSYAGILMDFGKTPYDFVIASSNKCLQGMAGLGFVISKKEKLDALKDRPSRSCYLNLFGQYDFVRSTGQMKFTPPVQVFYALNRALDELFEEGIENRPKRYGETWRCLMDGLERLGLSPLLPEVLHSKICTAIKAPRLKGYDFDGMHDYFYSRGVTIYPGLGGEEPHFRISNLGAIDKADMEHVLRLLGEYLATLKECPPK
jgi:2-aminoethylphosphonate-pyruvate transaminase